MALYGLKEIFQVARQLEKNGQLYYQEAATQCDDPDVSSLCSKIANQEMEHSKLIDKMEHLILANEEMQRLTWEEISWLQLDLEDGVLPEFRDLKSFIKEASVADILERAVQMERDSVNFYSSLMPEVDANHTRLLQELVKEESQHIKWLQKQKLNLSSN